MAIQFLRGTSSNRSDATSTKSAVGQPFYETDTGKLLISSSDQAASAATPILARPILDYVYPVGSIYMSVSSTNPSSLFGGTWTSWGQGRVPVGVAESGTFNSAEATGGEETHVLTTSEMPSHKHTGVENSNYLGYISTTSGALTATRTAVTADFSTGTSTLSYQKNPPSGTVSLEAYENTIQVPYGISAGGGSSHNNLQPYITCYMWKRTA